MKKLNLLAVILLGAAVVSCGDKEKDENNLFSIDFSVLKEQYKPTEVLPLSVLNTQNKSIDSVVYYINDKKIASVAGNKKYEASLQAQKLGYQNIKALVYYEGNNVETTGRIELVSGTPVKQLKYDIVNTYPHDNTSYTQGLEFYRDTLVEGIGQYGHSVLRKTDYKTGTVYKEIKLEGKYFGEGITIFNNKIYQLTWKEKTGFIYNADNLAKEKDYAYAKPIEGWGFTHDDKNLYQSDGTEKLYILDPTTLNEVDYINVYAEGRKVKELNELEWINNKIYANVWQTDAILVVDPKTGAVEGMINMSELKKKIGQIPTPDVLNGIAYNPKTNTIFVTGKNWDKMFEIRVKE